MTLLENNWPIKSNQNTFSCVSSLPSFCAVRSPNYVQCAHSNLALSNTRLVASGSLPSNPTSSCLGRFSFPDDLGFDTARCNLYTWSGDTMLTAAVHCGTHWEWRILGLKKKNVYYYEYHEIALILVCKKSEENEYINSLFIFDFPVSARHLWDIHNVQRRI